MRLTPRPATLPARRSIDPFSREKAIERLTERTSKDFDERKPLPSECAIGRGLPRLPRGVTGVEDEA